ncbi:hypothetical protein JCM17960_22600 [Magnetospira thiophila]
MYLAELDIIQESLSLERIAFQRGNGNDYDEGWMQDLLYRHPEILPFGEIDPSYAPAIPICREMPTAAGPIDIAYVTPNGQLTLVECKLWRNPEARREVVGQILDYAKEVSRWTYDDLCRAVRRAAGGGADPVYEMVSRQDDTVEQPVFIDDVARNLERGRFLLMIVGDGIREDVESITAFLQSHAGLHFTFSLVELALYQMPKPEPGGYILQPRVLARTVEIERAVVRRSDDGVRVDSPSPISPRGEAVSRGRLPTLTEEEILQTLAEKDSEMVRQLRTFLAKCREIGFQITSRRTLIIHWLEHGLPPVNFGSVDLEGNLNTYFLPDALVKAGGVEAAERRGGLGNSDRGLSGFSA